MRNLRIFLYSFVFINFSLFGIGHAEKWDMPMAYSATNFHSEHGVIFANKVKDYTNGKLEITVHPGGSLFKGGEIKRAVQTGQAPIGERFMSAHANEAPLLGWDNLPFLATTYEDNNKLWSVAKDKVNKQLSDLNLVALYTCPWPGQGFYFKKEVKSSADTQGVKFRSYNAATATLASTSTISANNSTNETVFPVFVDGATGAQGLESDTGLTYNPSTSVMS